MDPNQNEDYIINYIENKRDKSLSSLARTIFNTLENSLDKKESPGCFYVIHSPFGFCLVTCGKAISENLKVAVIENNIYDFIIRSIKTTTGVDITRRDIEKNSKVQQAINDTYKSQGLTDVKIEESDSYSVCVKGRSDNKSLCLVYGEDGALKRLWQKI